MASDKVHPSSVTTKRGKAKPKYIARLEKGVAELCFWSKGLMQRPESFLFCDLVLVIA